MYNPALNLRFIDFVPNEVITEKLLYNKFVIDMSLHSNKFIKTAYEEANQKIISPKLEKRFITILR
jgi:hypothetical protein